MENEQAESKQRGLVFSGYMIASYSGLVLGQLILVVHPQLGLELLMLVALCFALCLVPVALTGFGEEVDGLCTRGSDFDEQFTKPVAPSQLLCRIAAWRHIWCHSIHR